MLRWSNASRWLNWGVSMVTLGLAVLMIVILYALQHGGRVLAQQPPSSYAPVVMQEDFGEVEAKMADAKPAIMARQMELLDERYDLADRPAGA